MRVGAEPQQLHAFKSSAPRGSDVLSDVLCKKYRALTIMSSAAVRCSCVYRLACLLSPSCALGQCERSTVQVDEAQALL